MLTRVILTVIGSDRPGLTEALAGAVLSAHGNWLEGHLSRLGGKYVGSVLVELPAGQLGSLRHNVAHIDAAGLTVEVVVAGDATPHRHAARPVGGGSERPGIVREVSAALARVGVDFSVVTPKMQAGGSVRVSHLPQHQTLIAFPLIVSRA